MAMFSGIIRKSILVMFLSLIVSSSSGCTLTWGGLQLTHAYMLFWETLPPFPVSAYWSQQVEDAYYEEERYGKVEILDPIDGENAPLYCLDPPTPDEVIRAIPNSPEGGFAFFSDTQWNNVRMTMDLIVDKVEDCKFYPLAGPARMHKCHYKCTVYYTKIERSNYPIPFENIDYDSREVVYIDHDHLIRCAGPDAAELSLTP
ncbi:hypothetical protein Pla110_00530 [Polystyrenella longa]|uniref:Uncharacterized protein n=1 Tax=Polystyrenella longa TaxID=2528007 RepID=A0A518CGJ7_9PLAN|nr:hypothetical protein [Polystyrenella longa]QDU78352.1 hypothetical protein Pla110_00530 [Polystyrenella longa]